jgi:urease accessory protein
MLVVGFFALFHGYAHGTETPNGLAGLLFAAGFLVATALLLGVGVGVGLGLLLQRRTMSRRVIQAGGGAMALVGIAVLASAF